MKQEDTKQGNQQKQEYEQYVKSVTPTHNLWAQMGKAFLTGGIICCIGQGILNYTGNVLGMDPQTAGSWCRSLSTHHRLCQFRDSPGGGIPERRTGIRYRLQDIHHCRTCDPVRNFRQLGIGTDLLGAADVRDPIVS